MRKVRSLLLCFLLLAALPFQVFSADLMPGSIVDSADLLTPDEENKLYDQAAQVYDEYGLWVSIVTVNSLGGKSAESYADDFYDNNYYSSYKDGVLLLIAMDTREWAISTCGTAISRLTDWELDQLFYAMAEDLSENRFYAAFDIYLDALPGYLTESARAAPGARDFVRIILVSLLIGAAAGGITILIMRGQMNTAKAQSGASSYLVDGSFILKRRQDIFLYSRVSRTRKPENNGGSSVHRSSGGHSHGGRSGRF